MGKGWWRVVAGNGKAMSCLTKRQAKDKIRSMSKAPRPLTEQLRQAMETCGETRYAIAKATGIDQSVLSRFASGERGLSMEALDTLGRYLGLELVAKRRSKAKRKKGR